jgi:protein phosphatase
MTDLSSVFDSLSLLLSNGLSPYLSSPSTFSLPPISSGTALAICASARSAFSAEPTLLNLTGSFLIVGDLHGHVLELFRILCNFGLPPKQRYLLLGDLVDRGEFSVHTAVYVLLLKALYPDSVFVLRGNHESDDVNSTHGLLTEVAEVYEGREVFVALNEAFAEMPLAAIVNGEMVCVHGGIPRGMKTVAEIGEITRPVKPAENWKVEGLLWSDPGGGRRGGRFDASEAEIEEFCVRNGVKRLIRGHSAILGGIEYSCGNRVVTVFSISNYCDRGSGVAGVLEVREDGKEVEHKMEALPWVVRKAMAPVVKARERALDARPPKKSRSVGQPPIVMRQFMSSRGVNRMARIGVAIVP